MKRVLLLAVIVCSVLVAGLTHQGLTKQTDMAKDLQILKIKSTHEVFQYMAKLNNELGVQCNYCHDLKDYSADQPKKTITRDMMRMVEDVNTKYFGKEGDKQVTCWTCHQGAPEIETEMD